MSLTIFKSCRFSCFCTPIFKIRWIKNLRCVFFILNDFGRTIYVLNVWQFFGFWKRPCLVWLIHIIIIIDFVTISNDQSLGMVQKIITKPSGQQIHLNIGTISIHILHLYKALFNHLAFQHFDKHSPQLIFLIAFQAVFVSFHYLMVNRI